MGMKIHGYRFRLFVSLNMRTAAEATAVHLRRSGVDLDAKLLRPAYYALNIHGTKWFGYPWGGFTFDMAAEVFDSHPRSNLTMLGGWQWADATFNFGFREAPQLAEREVYPSSAGLVFGARGLRIEGSRDEADEPHIKPLQLANYDLPGAFEEMERLLLDPNRTPPGYRAKGVSWAGPSGVVTCQSVHQCEVDFPHLTLTIALSPIQS